MKIGGGVLICALQSPKFFGVKKSLRNEQTIFKSLSERLRKLSLPLILEDEGIVSGASIPPGFAPALAELERGSNRATPKTIPTSNT